MTLENALTEQAERRRDLIQFLLVVERARLDVETSGFGIPNIDSALTYLQGVHRYDSLRTLMGLMESFVETHANVSMCSQREHVEYEDVVRADAEPEYLKP